MAVSDDVKNYPQFCTMFGLTQIIKSPTGITCRSTSLIDHILSSLSERICQEGVINVGLSDHHSLISLEKSIELKLELCTKNQILFTYAVGADKNAMREINFPSYKYSEDVNWVYSDFQKLMTVIDNVAPCKTKPVKGNSQNWFDGEGLEKLRSRDKIFKAFKKARLHIDKELYKKAKCDAQKLIAVKNQAFFD